MISSRFPDGQTDREGRARVKWIKKGRIFEPQAFRGWFTSHAALPVVEDRGDHHRVYFSGRDENKRARIGFFEIDLERPERVLRVSTAPVLEPGPRGAFDDSGVTSSCLVVHEGRRYHYFTGWSLGVTVPFYLAAGMAIEAGDGSWQRLSAPVLERCEADPYLTASPWVRVEGGTWRAWYVSGTRWDGDAPKHYYNVRHAVSRDGLHWERRGTICIDYASPAEHALSRPCVLKDGPRYRMWYAYRGAAYRIGYAESMDGLLWERRDREAGIEPSDSGWDAEMVAYPCVFDHRGLRYMMYNGNGYGETGIGLAVLDA